MKINTKRIKQIWKFIIKYKFIITITAFVIWLLFLDADNFIYQIKNTNKIEKLEHQIKEMEKTIKDLKEKNDFLSPETVEKYAREVLLMKQEDEDIFIIDNQ